MSEPTMHCHLCPEVTAMDAIVDHVRLMHPDVWDGTVVAFSGDDPQEIFTAPRAVKIRCRLFGHRTVDFAFYDWSRPDVFGIRPRCDRCGANTSVEMPYRFVIVQRREADRG